jgi:glycosyltransferase involved in cell wall biosynthesis
VARIVTVYNDRPPALVNMAYVRWFRMAEALARLGHQVDIAANDDAGWRWWRRPSRDLAPNLRRVPLARVKWGTYDVVKVSYQEGFEILEKYGGANHGFIISRLGTVVGPEDADGFLFHGAMRERLYEAQRRMSRASRCIAVLNPPARELWIRCFGAALPVLLVPGAADSHIPPPSCNPYPADGAARCLFAGNLSWRNYAPQANATLSDKLNRLGALLLRYGIRLYAIGPGDADRLDPRYVTHLGVVPYERSWSYLQFADVGVELIKGSRFLHNNESSKIYHYLRAGLPVVTEADLPNTGVVEEARLGFVVASGDLESLAQKVAEAARVRWDRAYAVEYILQHHTWERRALVYHQFLTASLPA